MQLIEAMEELKVGKFIHRLAWKDKTFLKFENDKIQGYRYALGLYTYNSGIITSNRWMEVGEPKNEYSFLEALELMKQRRYIRYFSWEPDRYILLSPDNKEIWYHRLETHEFTPSVECLLANDWEVV